MTELITNYSEFIINNNGRNYSKKNTNIQQNKEGLYKAMWTVFCEGKQPDTHATEKWENVLNGRHGSGQITVEDGKMIFWFQDGTNNTLHGFKLKMTEILTNGVAPADTSGGKRRRRSSKRRGGKKRGKKSRRNTSRVR
jgi:hypothetical protein